MDFKQRIAILRKEANLTQEELAQKMGYTRAAVSAWELGRNEPSYNDAVKIANYFGVSVDYLLGKTDLKDDAIKIFADAIRTMEREYSNKQSSFTNVKKIQIYGTIPAGIPMECIEDIIDTEEISADMLKGGKEYFGLKIKGRSMIPTYYDGDVIIFEKVEDCESGQDCVVMVNGNDGTFKRVFKNENGIILQPLNTEFQPMIYTNQQIIDLPIRIIGVAREIRRKL